MSATIFFHEYTRANNISGEKLRIIGNKYIIVGLVCCYNAVGDWSGHDVIRLFVLNSIAHDIYYAQNC